MRNWLPVAKRFLGDPRLAAAYLPLAQSILGDLVSRNALMGVEHGSRMVRLADGTAIRVVYNGAAQAVEIDARAVSIKPEDWIRFIVFPSSIQAPNGWVLNGNRERILNPYHHDLDPRWPTPTELDNQFHPIENTPDERPYAVVDMQGIRRDQYLLGGNQAAWRWVKTNKGRWLNVGSVFTWWHSSAGDLPLTVQSWPGALSGESGTHRLWYPTLTRQFWYYKDGYWQWFENALTFLSDQTGQGQGGPQSVQFISTLPNLHVLQPAIYKAGKLFHFFQFEPWHTLIGGVHVLSESSLLVVIVVACRHARLVELQKNLGGVTETYYRYSLPDNDFFVHNDASTYLKWPFRFNQSGTEVSALVACKNAQGQIVTRLLTATFDRVEKKVLAVTTTDYQRVAVETYEADANDASQTYGRKHSHYVVNGSRSGRLPIALNYVDDGLAIAWADWASYQYDEERTYHENTTVENIDGGSYSRSIVDYTWTYTESAIGQGGVRVTATAPNQNDVVLYDGAMSYQRQANGHYESHRDSYHGPAPSYVYTLDFADSRSISASSNGVVDHQERPVFFYLHLQQGLTIIDSGQGMGQASTATGSQTYSSSRHVHNDWWYTVNEDNKTATVSRSNTRTDHIGYHVTLQSNREPPLELINQVQPAVTSSQESQTYSDLDHMPPPYYSRADLRAMGIIPGVVPPPDIVSDDIDFSIATDARFQPAVYLLNLYCRPFNSLGVTVDGASIKHSNHVAINRAVQAATYQLYPISVF